MCPVLNLYLGDSCTRLPNASKTKSDSNNIKNIGTNFFITIKSLSYILNFCLETTVYPVVDFGCLSVCV